MGEQTRIAWTDHSFNPWWGCVHVSPGCDNCYAEAFAKRTGHDVWGGGDRRFLSDHYWHEPYRWNEQAARSGRPARVFCASMCDVFEGRGRPDLEAERRRLWAMVEDTPSLTWQLLTKRPENVMWMVPHRWGTHWPENVWMGTTVEDQERAKIRVPRLIAIPAGVRFLSCEPLLGPVKLQTDWLRRLYWVICGGESGPHHRPLDLDAARSLRDQCLRMRVSFFFKQTSGPRPGMPGPDDLEAWKEFPWNRT